MKVVFHNHHAGNASWADRLEIQGLAYSDYQILVSTNTVIGQDGLATPVIDGRPGVNDIPDKWDVGINENKKPQFTFTFTDVTGKSVTTGVFTVQGPNGEFLE